MKFTDAGGAIEITIRDGDVPRYALLTLITLFTLSTLLCEFLCTPSPPLQTVRKSDPQKRSPKKVLLREKADSGSERIEKGQS